MDGNSELFNRERGGEREKRKEENDVMQQSYFS